MDQHDGEIEPVEVLLIAEIRVARDEDVAVPRERREQHSVLRALEANVIHVPDDEPGPSEERRQLDGLSSSMTMRMRLCRRLEQPLDLLECGDRVLSRHGWVVLHEIVD